MRQCYRLMLAVILTWMILAWTLLMGIRSRILLFPNAFVATAPPNAFVATAPPNASVATVPLNASVAAGLSKLEQHHVEIKSPKELLCELKTARLRTVDGSEQPFSSLGWSHLVPSVPLERLHRRQENQSSFKSCAVVASAGAMLHSGLGEEIDSHEAVMRFNHAPTGGYEKDVGTRTTFRLINEQILYKPKFQFKTSSLYHNITLVTWEIAPRDLNLTKWHAHGKLFRTYEDRRRLDPGQPFYVLHPSYVWQLWEVIQGTAQERITPNPPTSGFMGILVMMALCDEVHVYEYIPSPRQTALCHYFEDGYDIHCSLGGGWHPLKFEKALIRQIITGSETDLRRGRATLPGFSSVNCE